MAGRDGVVPDCARFVADCAVRIRGHVVVTAGLDDAACPVGRRVSTRDQKRHGGAVVFAVLSARAPVIWACAVIVELFAGAGGAAVARAVVP